MPGGGMKWRCQVATQADNLRAIRDQLIVNLTAEAASPKPSYSIDGESVDWATWARIQQDRIAQLNTMIQGCEPYFIVTRQSM